jgi:hypothetical protein
MNRTRKQNFDAAIRGAVAIAFILLPSIADAETWMLMGREGGCVSLAEAAQRKPVFLGITSPEDLAQRLQTEGHDATLREIGTAENRTVILDAPGAGLSVIFVPPQLCRD